LFISLALHYSIHSGNRIRKQYGIEVEYLSAFAKLQKVTISFIMFVRLYICPSAMSNSAPTGWIFMVYDIGRFFKNLSRKFRFYSNSDKNNRYFT
jgi:hypothetical protein